jgi:hypothetical protein
LIFEHSWPSEITDLDRLNLQLITLKHSTIFSGLISRWTILFLCMKLTASRACATDWLTNDS